MVCAISEGQAKLNTKYACNHRHTEGEIQCTECVPPDSGRGEGWTTAGLEPCTAHGIAMETKQTHPMYPWQQLVLIYSNIRVFH